MKRKRIYLSPPHINEEVNRMVREAFASNYIAPLGPMVDGFEAEFSKYTGIAHCLALSSGTAAMHLALRELQLGHGHEVLASTLTFIGGVSPVTYLGGNLVFIDSSRDNWTIDPQLLDEELKFCAEKGKLPKAVIITDLYGQCADLDSITVLCDAYGVPVICDSAEAIGSTYKGRHAGFGAFASIYSFNGNKIITTSGGGMLASANEAVIEHARYLSSQARDQAPYYQHSEIGYNYRMSNIVAAIGRGQLCAIDKRVSEKRAVFAAYQKLLADVPGISFMPEAPYGQSNRWLTAILVDPHEFGCSAEDIRLALEAENIESRPVWKPMHLQPVFSDCRARLSGVSEHIFRHGLCLPSGTAMQESDVRMVVDLILQARMANYGRKTIACGTEGVEI
jgi:dTDP-4-amino-4,6-dideoxygalactose transaminase